MISVPVRSFVAILFTLLTSSVSVANQPLEVATNRGIIPVSHFDVSPPLKFIAPATPLAKMQKGGLMIDPNGFDKGNYGVQDVDVIVQETKSINTISPVASFDGIPNIAGLSPPDPVGAVGLNHYVVMTNVHFQIFNKDGSTAMAAAANNTLWTGFGGACESQNAGDPIALYDQINDRWLLSQFTSNAVGGEFFNCVALSTTGDPTGTYYRWAFSTGGNFPDYPKYGIWSNAYLISTREFAGSSYAGVGAYAINKDDMLNGIAAPRMISFFAGRTNPFTVGDGLLPADIDGTALPPEGAPAYFVGSQDNGGPYGAPSDALNLWKFVIDFDTPANSSFTLTDVLAITPYDTIFTCPGGGRSCLPQPGTSNMIDIQSYRQRPLHRLAYRNFGSHESLVTNQSVEAEVGVAGIRWWEIRNPNTTPTVYQEGTYAPGVTDGIDRWMASAAMDGKGNIALGYSATSSTVFPSLWYTGRLETDPLGQMTQGEGSIVDGGGSQTGSQRWGDYTSLNIDPIDDCTFWYVNEYYVTSSASGWQTRVGAFKIDGCIPSFYITTTPTNKSICTTDDAIFQINSHSVDLFNTPVTLTTSGEPNNVTINFSSNPMIVPGNSQLTISNTGILTEGVYPMTINATDAILGTRTTDISFTAFIDVPNQPILTLPVNNAVDQIFRPDFTWAANSAESYLFELATDSGFTQIVESKTTTANATSISNDLNSNTTYYWRVTATNACGSGVVSAIFSFSTQAAPGDCANGLNTVSTYAIDFESGSSGWSSQGTGDTWQLSTARPHNGTNSFHAVDPTTVSDQELISPEITLPAGNSNLTLQFWNYQSMESRNATQCWDGGALEISIDNGTSWSHIPSSKMLTDPYKGAVSGLGDIDGWCGDPQDYINSVVDIDNFAGQTVRFRFRLGSDTSQGREGWYIDDIKVQSCSQATPEITITKTAIITTDNGYPGEADVNDVITYSVSVENTGGVALDTLTVNDSMVGALTCTPTTLAPSDIATCTDYTYTVQQSDIDSGGTIDNTVDATMTDPSNSSTYMSNASTHTIMNFALFKDSFEEFIVTSPPTLTLNTNPLSINAGSSTTITWTLSNDAVSCTKSGDWSGILSGNDISNGSHNLLIPTIVTNSIYNLECSNSFGSSGLQSATVNLVAANCAADQPPILAGAEDLTIIANATANAGLYNGMYDNLLGGNNPWPGFSGNNIRLSLTQNQYISAQFNSGNSIISSQIIQNPPGFFEGQASAGMTIAISECPGDFTTHMNQSKCLSIGGAEPIFNWSTDPNADYNNNCILDLNKTYYLNIVHSNNAELDNFSTSKCASSYCGILMHQQF